MQVNEQNYREALIRHLEGELSAGERRAVETFIASNTEAAEEWRRLQRTRLQPDMQVSFPNRASLYRAEEPAETVAVVRKLAPYPYLKYLSAIAAAVIFAAIYFVLKPQSGTEQTNVVAQEETVKPSPQHAESAQAPNKNQIVQGSGKTDPAPDKDKKKDEKKKAPRKTIIIVNDPLSLPQKDNNTLAKAEPLKGYDPRQVGIPAGDEYAKTEAENIPQSSLMAKADTRADFTPEEDEYVNTFTRVYRFLTRNVSLRKEVREEESVYAFRLETKNVSIYKTFRGF